MTFQSVFALNVLLVINQFNLIKSKLELLHQFKALICVCVCVFFLKTKHSLKKYCASQILKDMNHTIIVHA